MLKQALIIFGVLGVSFCAKQKHVDPFKALDQHITHTLAYHYLWPWSQLVQAAAAIAEEQIVEEPKIVSDVDKLEIILIFKKIKPDDLNVRVKNRNIIVEGKQKETYENQQFLANHFIQRFVMPPGSLQEEVTAVLDENGVLTVSVPKHDVPPTPPERKVPIEVIMLEKTAIPKDEMTEKAKEEPTTDKKVDPAPTTATPVEQSDLVEATTHVGKIRKKDLKDTTKTSKDNEVSKTIDGNRLDYTLVESE